MASRSLCSAGVLAKCFSISQTRCILDTKPFVRVLVPTHYQQQRGVRKRPPEPFARKRRARIQDSGLTPANESFLQEVIANEARSKVEELAKMNCPLKDGPWARGEWRKGTKRTGVVGVKIGCVPHWTTKGKKMYLTMLQVLDNHVVEYLTPDEFAQTRFVQEFHPKMKGKLGAVFVGSMGIDPRRLSPLELSLFEKHGVPPKRKVFKFVVTPNAAIRPGTPLFASHFRVGDYVDLQAKTIDYGFQGVIKKHGFKGGRGHGTTRWFRRVGSIAPGRRDVIPKGQKMPGYMGNKWRTLKGTRIYKIDTKYNVIYVKASTIPGPLHAYVRIMDSMLPNRVRERELDPPPIPTFYPQDSPEPIPEEIYHPDLFRFDMESILFPPDDPALEKKKKSKTAQKK